MGNSFGYDYNINIIENANTIIDVPFKDALFRDKSKQSRNTINTVETRQGEILTLLFIYAHHGD